LGACRSTREWEGVATLGQHIFYDLFQVQMAMYILEYM